MRFTLLLICLLLALPSFAGTRKELRLTGQALTMTQPSASTPTPGGSSTLFLNNVRGWRLTVCADSGNMTLANIEVYYHGIAGAWAQNPDLTMNRTLTVPCITFADVTTPAATGGFITFRSNGSTVSAGTTLSIYVEAWNETWTMNETQDGEQRYAASESHFGTGGSGGFVPGVERIVTKTLLAQGVPGGGGSAPESAYSYTATSGLFQSQSPSVVQLVSNATNATVTSTNAGIQLQCGTQYTAGDLCLSMKDYAGADNFTCSAAGNCNAAGSFNVGTTTFSNGLIQRTGSSAGRSLILGGATTNAVAEVSVKIYNATSLSQAGDRFILGLYPDNTGTTRVFGVTSAGGIHMDATNASGSPGSATINKPSGQFSIAAGANTATITNSLVSSTSVVLTVVQTNDSTCNYVDSVAPSAGSFVVVMSANCTGNTKIGFVVFN